MTNPGQSSAINYTIYVNGPHTIILEDVFCPDLVQLAQENPEWDGYGPLVQITGKEPATLPENSLRIFNLYLGKPGQLPRGKIKYFLAPESTGPNGCGFAVKHMPSFDTFRRELGIWEKLKEGRKGDDLAIPRYGIIEIVPHAGSLSFLMELFDGSVDQLNLDQFNPRSMVKHILGLAIQFKSLGYYWTDIKTSQILYKLVRNNEIIFRSTDFDMVPIGQLGSLATYPAPLFRYDQPAQESDVEWALLITIISLFGKTGQFTSRFCREVIPESMTFEWTPGARFHLLQNARASLNQVWDWFEEEEDYLPVFEMADVILKNQEGILRGKGKEDLGIGLENLLESIS